jgi:hypothetical protein
MKCQPLSLVYISATAAANINIVAVHQHMTGENPRMRFLHYYGRGKALDLARGVKAAVNTQPLAANR